MRRITLALLLALLFAPAAWASEATERCNDSDWTAVDGTDYTADATASPVSYTVRSGQCLVYRFTTTEDSDLIELPSGGIVMFYPSIDGSDAAQVYIRKCSGGNRTVSVNTCRPIETELGTQLFTGAAGLWARTLPPGSYYVDNSTSAGGDTALVVFDAR